MPHPVLQQIRKELLKKINDYFDQAEGRVKIIQSHSTSPAAKPKPAEKQVSQLQKVQATAKNDDPGLQRFIASLPK